ncbi:hypothetical protein INS49_010390 [Diaporthe citri]|uniref:uncharacterized protein n=1 Tax=Diaporthe citri TaxID=83186 RepID=UPI001C804A21|nr:uncharacterized protein INS49_010390 [Diaporthe citri]KAG6362160.1 hypothetical protein INS49_010390 [Diaporthe citri]
MEIDAQQGGQGVKVAPGLGDSRPRDRCAREGGVSDPMLLQARRRMSFPGTYRDGSHTVELVVGEEEDGDEGQHEETRETREALDTVQGPHRTFTASGNQLIIPQTATVSLEALTRETQQQRSEDVTPREEPGDAFESGQGPHLEFSLPPVDTGKDAWLFLAACFRHRGAGFPFSFGIFQKYYSSHEPFRGSGNIAIVGTCTSGIMYLSGLPALVLNRMYPRLGRWSPMVGLLIMCLSLALSSFSTTVTQLIATQGVLYAIGGSIGYLPCRRPQGRPLPVRPDCSACQRLIL